MPKAIAAAERLRSMNSAIEIDARATDVTAENVEASDGRGSISRWMAPTISRRATC